MATSNSGACVLVPKKVGVKISDTLQIWVVYLLCCCRLYLLVSPNVIEKENGKEINKEYGK
jgi:hypothetical protein